MTAFSRDYIVRWSDGMDMDDESIVTVTLLTRSMMFNTHLAASSLQPTSRVLSGMSRTSLARESMYAKVLQTSEVKREQFSLQQGA